jgi:hypothetical protein
MDKVDTAGENNGHRKKEVSMAKSVYLPAQSKSVENMIIGKEDEKKDRHNYTGFVAIHAWQRFEQ